MAIDNTTLAAAAIGASIALLAQYLYSFTAPPQSSTRPTTTTHTKRSATVQIPCGQHTIRQGNFGNATLESLRIALSSFAQHREWDQFHSPRNLALALVGEVGELAECFQWKSDAQCNDGLAHWKSDQVIHVGEELSDVLLYLIRLADKCNIDLAAAAQRKLTINGLKYPAATVKGRSEKYTEYKTEWRANAAQVR